MFVLGELGTDHSPGWFLEFLTLWFFRESKLIKDADEEKASLQKSISVTSALLTEKDAELEKLRNEVEYLPRWTFSLPLSVQTPSLSYTAVFQVTVLRGENASAKSLHSVGQQGGGSDAPIHRPWGGDARECRVFWCLVTSDAREKNSENALPLGRETSLHLPHLIIQPAPAYVTH